MPTEFERRQFVRQTFNKVASRYGQGAARFFHISGEVMAKLLPLSGSEAVLDLACGTGATAIPLARCVPDGSVIAVDLSTAMLAVAKQRAFELKLKNLQFIELDMTQLPFLANSFDCASCAFGLFFVDDMSALLKHIASTVKSGGCILVCGFCSETFQPMAQLCLDRLRRYGVEVPEQIGWQRMAEPEQLQAIFTAAGLPLIHIERQSLGYYIDVDEWWDIVWNAGFRGLVESLGDQLETFKKEHLDEISSLSSSDRLWLDVDVHFTQAIVP